MENNAKKSFIFNLEWAEVLKDYPAEVRYEVYDAIIWYAQSGTLPELKPLAKMAFAFIKKEMDYNNSKYEEISEARRIAGKKGMEKRWGARDKESEITNDNKNNKSYQTITNDNKNNINDNVIDNDNDNDIKKEIASTDAIKKEGAIAPMSPIGDSLSIDYEHLAQFFNSELDRNGSLIPHIESIRNARRNMVNARAKEHGKKAIKTVISKAASSPFLNGRNDRGFIANFDWIIRPNNFVKVLEGNYDDKLISNGNNRQVNSKESRAAAVQEQVARLLAEDDARKARES